MHEHHCAKTLPSVRGFYCGGVDMAAQIKNHISRNVFINFYNDKTIRETIRVIQKGAFRVSRLGKGLTLDLDDLADVFFSEFSYSGRGCFNLLIPLYILKKTPGLLSKTTFQVDLDRLLKFGYCVLIAAKL